MTSIHNDTFENNHRKGIVKATILYNRIEILFVFLNSTEKMLKHF